MRPDPERNVLRGRRLLRAPFALDHSVGIGGVLPDAPGGGAESCARREKPRAPSSTRDPRWSMARTKRSSSGDGNQLSFDVPIDSPSGIDRSVWVRVATPSTGGLATSGWGGLIHPAVEQLHVFGRPWCVTRHRSFMQFRCDRRGVADDIVVLPEIERPPHGITILLSEHRPYIGCERDRTRRRGTIRRWGTH